MKQYMNGTMFKTNKLELNRKKWEDGEKISKKLNTKNAYK